MKFSRVLLLLSVFFSGVLNAQENTSFPTLRFGAGFYSESFWLKDGAPEGEPELSSFFYNNGVNLEAQYTLLARESQKKEGRKLNGYEVLNVGLNTCFYSVQNQSSNSIITLDFSLEKEFFFGLDLFAKVGIGALNTRILGDVYSVDSQGNVTEGDISGSETVLPASIGLGWNFESLINIPLCIRVRTMHFSKSFGPYSTYKAGMLFGIEYRLKSSTVLPIKRF